jgi:hypothetical protein
MHKQPRCPLCGGRTFEPVRARPNARCATCRSVYRTRSAWLLLTEYCRVSPSQRIAHFAPERPIALKLRELCGESYEAYDIDPAAFAFAQARKMDLCADLGELERGAYDIVIHNHVIEHLPCNYTMVLLGLHALLKPGGFHVFSCPLLKGYSRSDLSPALSGAEREKLFGQNDHVRRFGQRDFDRTLGMVFGLTAAYSLADYVPAEVLLEANVPAFRWTIEAGTVFVVRKAP